MSEHLLELRDKIGRTLFNELDKILLQELTEGKMSAEVCDVTIESCVRFSASVVVGILATTFKENPKFRVFEVIEKITKKFEDEIKTRINQVNYNMQVRH